MSEIETDLSTAGGLAIKQLLVGIDGIGNSVFLSRVYPQDVKKLPCICVYSPTETVSQITGLRGQRAQKRDIIYSIVVVFAYPEVPSDGLEIEGGRIRAEIERRLAAAIKAGPIGIQGSGVGMTDMFLNRVDRGFSDQGSKTVVAANMQFGGVIHHREGDHAVTFAIRT